MLLTRGQIPDDLAEFFEPAECGECFVCALIGVFREVRRVLRDDGTVWLNLGDSYSGSGPSGASYQSATTRARAEGDGTDGAFRVSRSLEARGLTYAEKKPIPAAGTKAKDLIGIPWMVAFALRTDGWFLRSEIIWAKPNPMPESVTDRPTKAHEQVFLLSKMPRYYYDADAVREAHDGPLHAPGNLATGAVPGAAEHGASREPDRTWGHAAGRNKRSVWTVATQPFSARGLAGGSGRTASQGCPVHGVRAQRERAERDGAPQGASPARRTLRTESHPEQASLLELSASGPDPVAGLSDGSAASCHSTSRSRTAAESGLCDSVDAPSPDRTACTPWAPDRVATNGHIPESRSAADCVADVTDSDPSEGTPDHIAGTCTCPPIVDHFAVFPPKLIEPCILAGCPERCCSECGAPWERVVEVESADRIPPQTAQMGREAHFRGTRPVGQRGSAGMPNGQQMASRSARTLGFKPSCAHDAEPKPGTVLDPFAGAGTTGMVALRHGRSFVGVELNAEYAQLARARIIADCPLWNTGIEVPA